MKNWRREVFRRVSGGLYGTNALFCTFYKLLSGVLTELGCPIFVLLEVLLTDGRLVSHDSVAEVIHGDLRATQLRRLFLREVIQSHVGAFRVGGESGQIATTGSPLKARGILATTQGHHQRFVEDDGHVRAGVAFGQVTELNPVLIGQIVRSFRTRVLQDTCAGSSIRQVDADSLLETSSHSLIDFPGDVSGSKN